jgi:hypothetical protein
MNTDFNMAYYWGLKLNEWQALTDRERRDLRDRVTQAPRWETR